MPGDRYHLVGFLASPKAVLSDQNYQLAIPYRPAPNELILIDSRIDPNRYYEGKCQLELLENLRRGECNSVVSNIILLSMYKENQFAENRSRYADKSMLIDFINAQHRRSDDEIAELLRENNTIQPSPELLQQRVENEIPVGAVWLQGLIDTRRIKKIRGFEDVTTVRQAIERINGDNLNAFFNEIKIDSLFVKELIKTRY